MQSRLTDLRSAGKLMLCMVLMGLALPLAAAAQNISATARVANKSIFEGESFPFEIHVSGSDRPEKPDLSHLAGVTVTERGSRQNNSSQVTVVNGRMTQNVSRGYVFSYMLTPTRAGNITIPMITVKAGGAVTRTRPVAITVAKPAETEDAKLRIKLSLRKCYVGEPITLTMTWYFRQEAQNVAFNLPALSQDLFHQADQTVKQRAGRQYYKLPLNGEEVIGESGQASLEGKSYTTIEVQKLLIPRS